MLNYVPLVTWPSNFSRGRFSLAMYRQMGLEALVASSAAQYSELVLRLAKDVAYNRQMRLLIRRAVRGGGGVGEEDEEEYEEEEKREEIEQEEIGKEGERGEKKEREGSPLSLRESSRLFRNADVAREWISFVLRLFKE